MKGSTILKGMGIVLFSNMVINGMLGTIELGKIRELQKNHPVINKIYERNLDLFIKWKNYPTMMRDIHDIRRVAEEYPQLKVDLPSRGELENLMENSKREYLESSKILRESSEDYPEISMRFQKEAKYNGRALLFGYFMD